MNKLNAFNGWAGKGEYFSPSIAQGYLNHALVVSTKSGVSTGCGSSDPKPSACGAADPKPSACGTGGR